MAAGACEDGTAPAPPLCDAPASPHLVEYLPLDMPDSLLWYRGTALQSFDDYPQDPDGVIVFEYDGAWHYNPVQMAQRGLWFGDNYRRTGDSRYLERAEAHARRLIEEGVWVDGALYLPYHFAFRLHGRAEGAMPVPWFSGMGQGQALSLFLRLHEMTGDPGYLEAAHGLMQSFHTLHGKHEPWVARIDCEGYYWIEEFPEDVSTRTLNGFIFGMWGVYEYWRYTGDPGALELVRASLATLKHYLPEYRVPGEPSLYCLKHEAQYPKYHSYHIEQLLYLHRMTGDPYFQEVKALLEEDHPYQRWNATPP